MVELGESSPQGATTGSGEVVYMVSATSEVSGGTGVGVSLA